jgi:cysteine-rich repeat protein
MKLNLYLLLIAALVNISPAQAVEIIGDLCGQILPPGVYTAAAACGLACPLELDAKSDANATWTFQCGAAFAIAANSGVFFTDKGSPYNVVWEIGAATAVGAGSTMIGQLTSAGAITLGAAVRWTGTLTSTSGAITLGASSTAADSIVAEGAITIAAGAVSGDLISNIGAVTLGAGAIAGFIVTDGVITLAANVITGDLTSTNGAITLGADAEAGIITTSGAVVLGAGAIRLFCGNNILDNNEQCEPPNVPGCNSVCESVPFCGDGIVDLDEDCDGGDGCDTNCTSIPYCGDGDIDLNEECDGGDNCNADCTSKPFCGDGKIQDGEQCEEPNTPGCSATCQIDSVCGNSIIEFGEECDPPGGSCSETTCQTIHGGGVQGDPHFKTWAGKRYDFHGECDLILFQSSIFNSGMGVDLHVRTTMRREMSYISSAALRIGTDILEVASNGVFYKNGVMGAAMPNDISGFPVTHSQPNENQHIFAVDLGDGESIKIKTYKDFVSVMVDGAQSKDFGDSVGMMGALERGVMLARDGNTVITDHNTFGQEWQVLDTEPKLFDTSRLPQYPQACTMPPPAQTSLLRRRLSESKSAELAAEKACAHWGEGKDDCVFDVLTTGDLEMAVVGAY